MEKSILTRDKALEVLQVSDQVLKPPYQLFKKDTLLVYLGKCREAGIIITTKNEQWVGQKEIFERHFGYIVDFIIEDKSLHLLPKIGDVIYIDPYAGELVPYQVDKEMFYYKLVKLNEINLIIK